VSVDHLPESRPEGQQLCPICWPDADPREYAVMLCAEHGAAREARAPDDARLDNDPAYCYSQSEGDGVTGRLYAELLHRPHDKRRK
jgi:hypothetical protein